VVSPTRHGHRPHDLLWLDDAAALTVDGAMPPWATPAWLAVAPVVVRRAPLDAARGVPVGLRGAARSERCAAHAAADRVVRALTPEGVAHRVTTAAALRESTLPCLRTLARLAPALDASALAWGVTGSVGFTLASGFDVLRPDSDLDLLVRAPFADDADALLAVAALLRGSDARIDVQVETPVGAFALQEWLRTGGPVLLKTNRGPVLTDDAWSTTAEAA